MHAELFESHAELALLALVSERTCALTLKPKTFIECYEDQRLLADMRFLALTISFLFGLSSVFYFSFVNTRDLSSSLCWIVLVLVLSIVPTRLYGGGQLKLVIMAYIRRIFIVKLPEESDVIIADVLSSVSPGFTMAAMRILNLRSFGIPNFFFLHRFWQCILELLHGKGSIINMLKYMLSIYVATMRSIHIQSIMSIPSIIFSSAWDAIFDAEVFSKPFKANRFIWAVFNLGLRLAPLCTNHLITLQTIEIFRRFAWLHFRLTRQSSKFELLDTETTTSLKNLSTAC